MSYNLFVEFEMVVGTLRRRHSVALAISPELSLSILVFPPCTFIIYRFTLYYTSKTAKF